MVFGQGLGFARVPQQAQVSNTTSFASSDAAGLSFSDAADAWRESALHLTD
jgi:hypothetical protein